MGKIFYVMGKSASGKDTVYKKLRERFPSLKTVVLYTTRPIREGETDGQEYHFTTEEELSRHLAEGKVIEHRAYQTVAGPWSYFTLNDGQLQDQDEFYLMIGTLESYGKMLDYFGQDRLFPIYITVEDGLRLRRALDREAAQKAPNYSEVCRRFLADEQDFCQENRTRFGIDKEYQNGKLDSCVKMIEYDLRQEMAAGTGPGGQEDGGKQKKGSAAFLWLLACVLVTAGVIGFMGKSYNQSGNNRIDYVKDNNFYTADVGEEFLEPYEHGGPVFTDREWQEQDYSRVWGSRILSHSGDDAFWLSGNRLYQSGQDGKSKWAGSQVETYIQFGDKLIYLRQDGGLSAIWEGSSRRLSEETFQILAGRDGSNLCWSEEKGIYLLSPDTGQQPRKLSESGTILDCSEDFTSFFLNSNGVLQKADSQGNLEELAMDVLGTYCEDTKTDSLYYEKDDGLYYYESGAHTLLGNSAKPAFECRSDSPEKATPRLVFEEAGVYYLADGTDRIKVPCGANEILAGGVLSPREQAIYYLHREDLKEWNPSYSLSRLTFAGEKTGERETLAEEVFSTLLVRGQDIYYMKGFDYETVTLFKNDTVVAENVLPFSVRPVPGSEDLLFIANVDEALENGSLYLTGEKRTEEICEDVYTYDAVSSQEITILTGYMGGSGDLKFYNGTEVLDVDSDVMAFLPRGNGDLGSHGIAFSIQ